MGVESVHSSAENLERARPTMSDGRAGWDLSRLFVVSRFLNPADAEIVMQDTEVELPPPLGIRLKRVYRSRNHRQRGLFGRGWSSCLDWTVDFEQPALRGYHGLTIPFFRAAGNCHSTPFFPFTLELSKGTARLRCGEAHVDFSQSADGYGRPAVMALQQTMGWRLQYSPSGILEQLVSLSDSEVRFHIEVARDGLLRQMVGTSGSQAEPFLTFGYRYSATEELSAVLSGSRDLVSYRYARGRPELWRRAGGVGTRFWHDDELRCNKVEEADRTLTESLRSSDQGMVQYVDQLGRTQSYFFTAQGLISGSLMPGGVSGAWAWDDHGRLTCAARPGHGCLYQAHNAAGLIEMGVPGDLVLTADRDPSGALSGWRSNRGDVIELARDDSGLAIGVRLNACDTCTAPPARDGKPSHAVTDMNSTSRSESAGRRIELMAGQETAYLNLNAWSRLLTVELPDGDKAVLLYDAAGGLSTVKRQADTWLQLQYDADGRLLSEVGIDRVLRQYAYKRNVLAEITTGACGPYQLSRNSDGLPVLVLGPGGRRRTLDRDQNEQIIRDVITGRGPLAYERDDYRRITAVVYGQRQTKRTDIEYDGNARVVAIAHDGRRDALTYASDGRLVRASAAGVSETTFVYGDGGRDRAVFWDDEYSMERCWRSGGLLSERRPYLSLECVQTRDVTDYQVAGHHVRVEGGIQACCVSTDGALTIARGCDGAGRVVSIDVRCSGTTAYSLCVSYGEAVRWDGSQVGCFQLDAGGRNVSWTSDRRIGKCEYDDGGNLRFHHRLGSATMDERHLPVTYTGGVQLKYDTYGNVGEVTTACGVLRFSYDGSNRLREASCDGLQVIALSYDGLGYPARIARENNKTRFYWADNELLAEDDGGTLVDYFYRQGSLLGRVVGGTLELALVDPWGSTVGFLGSGPDFAAYRCLDPFSDAVVATGDFHSLGHLGTVDAQWHGLYLHRGIALIPSLGVILNPIQIDPLRPLGRLRLSGVLPETYVHNGCCPGDGPGAADIEDVCASAHPGGWLPTGRRPWLWPWLQPALDDRRDACLGTATWPRLWQAGTVWQGFVADPPSPMAQIGDPWSILGCPSPLSTRSLSDETAGWM